MKENVDYIIFVIKQAKEAEEFGFTRNEIAWSVSKEKYSTV